MNRNTDDQKNTNDTEGHLARPGRIDEAATEGHMPFRKVEEADTEGHMPYKRVEEADTEGHAVRGKAVEEADTEGHMPHRK